MSNSLLPSTIAGLSDDTIAFPDIGKLFPGAGERALACHQAVILSGTPFIRALGPAKLDPCENHLLAEWLGALACRAPVPPGNRSWFALARFEKLDLAIKHWGMFGSDGQRDAKTFG